MARRFSTTLIIVLLVALSVRPQQHRASTQEAGGRRIVPLNKFSFDQRFEMVSGDPAMPHTHPEDENIVVVKGSSALGMGDRFDRQALDAMLTITGLKNRTGSDFAPSARN